MDSERPGRKEVIEDVVTRLGEWQRVLIAVALDEELETDDAVDSVYGSLDEIDRVMTTT